MTKDEIRLECLKLAHRHDRKADDVVAHAREYERYVVGEGETPAPVVETERRRGPGRPRKNKADNLFA